VQESNQPAWADARNSDSTEDCELAPSVKVDELQVRGAGRHTSSSGHLLAAPFRLGGGEWGPRSAGWGARPASLAERKGPRRAHVRNEDVWRHFGRPACGLKVLIAHMIGGPSASLASRSPLAARRKRCE